MRVVGGATEHYVIDQIDVDRTRGFAQLARELDVGGAWRGIAARVIVLCGVPNYVQ